MTTINLINAQQMFVESSGFNLALGGNAMAVNGIVRVFDGEVVSGIVQSAQGMAAIEIGAHLSGAIPAMASEIRDQSLISGLAVTAIMNGAQVFLGSDNQSRGAASFKTLVAGTLLFGLNHVDFRTAALVHQTLTIGGAGCCYIYSGVKQIADGKRMSGAAHISLGASAVIFAAGRAWQHLTLSYSLEMPDEIAVFLKSHSQEVDELYRTQAQVGDFQYFGKGASKKAFEHKDLPGYLVKIPHQQKSLWSHGKSDAEVHYENLQKARQTLSHFGYQHLAVPDSFLSEVPGQGFMVVEQKFDFDPSAAARQSARVSTKVNHELSHFKGKRNLCDVYTYANAGFLDGRDDVLGIYDFDCELPLRPSLVERAASASNLAAVVVTIAARTMGDMRIDILAAAALANTLGVLQRTQEHDLEDGGIHASLITTATIGALYLLPSVFRAGKTTALRAAAQLEKIQGVIDTFYSIPQIGKGDLYADSVQSDEFFEMLEDANFG